MVVLLVAMAASSFIFTHTNSITTLLEIKSIRGSSSSKSFLLNSLCISKLRAIRSHLGSNLKTPFYHQNRSKRINWIWGLVALVPIVVQRVLTFTKETDTAAETVEKAAEDVEKLAEDASETLPEGRKLKEVVGFVEKVAKETAKDAQLIKDLMDKVEEVDQEIESNITNGSKTNAQVDSEDEN